MATIPAQAHLTPAMHAIGSSPSIVRGMRLLVIERLVVPYDALTSFNPEPALGQRIYT